MRSAGARWLHERYVLALIAAACLAVLGGLADTSEESDQVMGLALLGLALGAAAVPLVVLAATAAARPGSRPGDADPGTTAGRALMLLVPFTVLAALAEVFLDWEAAGPFAAAGLMVGASAAGSEAAAVAGGGWRRTVPCIAVGAALAGAWMLGLALVQRQLAGGG